MLADSICQMIARLQSLIALMLMAGSLTWAAYFWSHGRPLWAVAGAALIVLGYAAFLAAEFVVLHFVQTDEVAARPVASQLLAAWAHEALTAPRVFLWRQPFRSNLEPDNLGSPSRTGRGVVLVHGFVCNRGLWNPWMHALRKRGVPFVAVNLEPPFGSIDRYAEGIEAAVSRLESATGQTPVLVGHSMGGLAIRAWLARFDAARRAHRVVTIGTPHRGTWLARFGHTANGRQMRKDSPWLAALARAESAAGDMPYAAFTCFFGHCDNIVFPASTATLPGARNVHLPGTPHVHMAFHPDVFDEVVRWLR